MNPAAITATRGLQPKATHSTTEPAWVRWLLIGVAVAFMGLFLVLPLLSVFIQAFAKGVGFYFATVSDPTSA